MPDTKFVVSRFTNRNAVISWRVSGRLNGVRIRKNFKSKEEAAAEKASLELKALQVATNTRAASTFLTEAQLREAEAAFTRLKEQSRSLSFYLDYALTNHREPTSLQTLASAITEYKAVKAREQMQGIISEPQLITIKRHLTVFQTYFPDATVAELSAAQLTTYCQHGNAGLKTYNNRRGVLSTFFKFAIQNDWVAANPITKVPYHRIAHRRGSAKTFTAQQAAALMAYAESYHGGRLVPYFALCLFAGIRPCLRTGEILKLKPENVRLDTGVILIEPEVSKVKMKRTVMIHPNLAAWLRAYPLHKFPIIIPALQKRRAKIAKSFGLSHDIMRHTFISMHVAKYRSMGEAALQAGNSETIIRKHYLDLKTPAEAEEFFGIFPTKQPVEKANPLEFPSPAPALEATG